MFVSSSLFNQSCSLAQRFVAPFDLGNYCIILAKTFTSQYLQQQAWVGVSISQSCVGMEGLGVSWANFNYRRNIQIVHLNVLSVFVSDREATVSEQ